jgi:hypothetical protein
MTGMPSRRVFRHTWRDITNITKIVTYAGHTLQAVIILMTL